MIIKCNSCNKKFVVPDSAISANGRLVQCSACGNKWTQYPLDQKVAVKKSQTIDNTTKPQNLAKKNKKNKIKKRDGPTLYSSEYLEKKHGIKITSPNVKKIKKTNNKKNSFGFYSYLLLLIIFVVFIFGVLHLTKDILIIKYPFSEIYVNYLYETLNNLKTIFKELI
jgi:predicted Zn finger-like uncharacterized protein